MTALSLKNLLTKYTSTFFNLDFNVGDGTVLISMQMQTPIINTSQIAGTSDLLKSYLPSVLQTKCFNDAKVPFDVEVNRTEFGHLFEHILIEALCIEKINSGADYAEFSGRTTWDWYKNPTGSFLIKISIQKSDLVFLPKALRKTIRLTEVILGFPRDMYPAPVRYSL